MKKYIIYDVETSGKYPETSSLLTAHFRVVDTSFQILDSISFKMKPDDGIYKVDVGALKYNKINLIDHDADALCYKHIKPKLLHFLAKNSEMGTNKLIPVGHNLHFDDSFIQYHLLNKSEWDVYVHYGRLDTSTIAEFLKLMHIMPHSVQGLSNIAALFGVTRREAHTADGDVSMTADLLNAMKQRMMRPSNE